MRAMKGQTRPIYPLGCIIQCPDTRCAKRSKLFSKSEREVETRLLYDGRDGSGTKGSEIIHSN